MYVKFTCASGLLGHLSGASHLCFVTQLIKLSVHLPTLLFRIGKDLVQSLWQASLSRKVSEIPLLPSRADKALDLVISNLRFVGHKPHNAVS